MRRALAAAILGPSLLVASLAWSAFGMLNTMLDPGRSERIADTLLEDDAVQAQLRQSIAGAVGSQLPTEVPLSDEQLEAGAGVALENPVVALLVRDAFVQAHQAFLGEAEPPKTLDIGSAASEVRSGTLGGLPGADALLPDTPGLVIDLPTDKIPNLGGFRRWLNRAAPLMALIAAAGVALALVTAKNRAAVLRRAGFWAMGSSVIWLVLNIGVPYVAARWFSGQAAIAASLVDALFGEMLVPAIVLACVGLALVVVSIMLPAMQGAGEERGRDGGVLMRRAVVNDGPKPVPMYEAPARPVTPQYVQDPASGQSRVPPQNVAPPPPVERPQNPQQSHQQSHQEAHQQQHQQPAPAVDPGEWRPGVGYVAPATEPSSAPTGFEAPQAPVRKPANPQWVAGLGYVDEDGNPIDS